MINFVIHILFASKHCIKWKVIFWINSLLLIYLTVMPSLHYKSSFHHMDKVFHVIGFGSFAFLCFLAFPKLKPISTLIISMSLGIGIEIVQAFLPSRSFSYLDMVADFLGILSAILFLVLVKKFKPDHLI